MIRHSKLGGPMKKLFAFLFVLTLSVISVQNISAGKQDFVLVNGTGVDIHELYVSPTKSDDWGEDILGQDILKDGQQATIGFSRDESACLWDFSVSDPDEASVEWSGIDLCKYEKITLHIKGEKVWATFE